MSVGDVGFGLGIGLAKYIQAERDKNRQLEDAQLDQQMSLIKELSSRPDANPALMGQALHDLMDLQAAKGGKGKAKTGMEGVMGAHELPISQFLQGIQQGTRPMVGPTTEDVPTQVPAAPQRLPQAAGGATGVNMPSTPGDAIRIPPEPLQGPPGGAPIINQDLLSAARAVGPMVPPQMDTKMVPRPVEPGKQPYFRSPQEMAEQEGLTAGTKAGAVLQSQMETEYQTLLKMGADPGLARQTVMEKYGLKRTAPVRAQASNATINGKKQVVFIDPVTRQITGLDGSLVQGEVELEGKPGQPGSQYSVHYVPDKDGNYQAVWLPKSPPTEVPAPPQAAPTAPPAAPTQPPTQPTPQPPASTSGFNPASVPKEQWGRAPAGATEWVAADGTPVKLVNGRWLDASTIPAASAGAIPTPPQTSAQALPKPPALAVSHQPSGIITAPSGIQGKGTAETVQRRNTVDAVKDAATLVRRLESALDSKYKQNRPNTFGTQLSEAKNAFQYSWLKRSPTDPVMKEMLPLVDNLTVLITQPYLRGLRNMLYVNQIQKHTPHLDLPFPDSPQLIQDKINNIKRTFNDIMSEAGEKPPFPEAGVTGQ